MKNTTDFIRKMTIKISKTVYFTIIAASVRFANQRIPYNDWLEVYGIFVGNNEGDDVIISKTYPITHQKKRPEDIIDTVYWSNEDYESFAIIDDDAFAQGEFTIGWWHSHPGHRVMMTGLDIQTTYSYQQFNPLAISLVFNPQRLAKQLEMPSAKGDPVIQLKNDPGFKIFRLNDINKGMHSTYHEVDYQIAGFENEEQLISQAQKLIIEITNFLPKDNIVERYEQFVNERIAQLNSLLIGTEEYLMTLTRKGETSRIPEVMENQMKEIREYVAETFIKIGNIKEFMDYLEFKERDNIIPKVNKTLSKWDEVVSKLDQKLAEISNKF